MTSRLNWQTTNNIATYLTNQINNQSVIPSTDVIQLTMTLKMTTAQVVETSVTVNNSPIQDYVLPRNQTQLTFVMTHGFKPLITTTTCLFLKMYISLGAQTYCKSTIKPGLFSNKPSSLLSLSPLLPLFVFPFTVLIKHDCKTSCGFGMVFSPTGSSDLLVILGCNLTSNFLYLSFSTSYSSSFGRTDTILISSLLN